MTASNSSISNSDIHIDTAPGLTPAKILTAGIWAVVWLVLLDIAINIIFAMPKSPLDKPNKLQSYFDYGRSVEGKIRYMVGRDAKNTAIIANAGWLVEENTEPQPTVASSPEHILVAAYGQSFTKHIVSLFNEMDAHFEIRMKGGPSATLSHSYAFFKEDASQHHADVVVIGILASSLPFSMSPTISTINFEGAVPYTYPMYHVQNGQLTAVDPVIHSLAELRTALLDKPEIWDQYIDLLQAESPTYNSMVFKADWLDYSAFGRLIRRAIGQKHVADMTARYSNSRGFTNTDGLLDTSNALIANFVSEVKAKGQMPYIILFQDRGYKDYLALAFEAKLKQTNTPYFSTHLIAPSTDARNFISDGHFIPEVENKIAHVIHDDILAQLGKYRTSAH